MKTAVSLKTLITGMDAKQRAAFAKAAKTTDGQIRQVAYGHRVASSALATRIEIASMQLPGDVVVPRESMSGMCAVCDMLKTCRSGSMQIHQYKVAPAQPQKVKAKIHTKRTTRPPSPLSPKGQALAKRRRG